MKKLAAMIVVCLTAGSWNINAQNQSTRKLEEVKALIESSTSEKLSGWTHRSIKLMEGSNNVIIDQWELGERIIKVSILYHDSSDQADLQYKDSKRHHEVEEKATKKHGVKDFKIIKEEIPSLGDGGFLWETYKSTGIAFKKDNLTIYVVPIRPELDHDVATARNFAQIIAEILSAH